MEFKLNDDEPKEVGEYISALANAAALLGKDAGYIVWGVADAARQIVGTQVDPRARKVGNEPAETWWAHLLRPRIEFRFDEGEIDGQRVVLLRVQPADSYPVAFHGTEWIRIGSAKKKLSDHPGTEKQLWQVLARRSFEGGIAASAVDGDRTLALLDYPKFFELAKMALPSNRSGILDRLCVELLLVGLGGDRFDITNLGALLFARDLRQFDSLRRKAVRFVRYRGKSRVETLHEWPELNQPAKGYAAGFEDLVQYVNDQSPRNEVLGAALRGEVRMYPPRAVRELVANALIHQDFALSGTGPMIEMFDDRLEVSNPGLPVIDPLRFIDHAPRSRNERLADLMRRLHICEERGSGFDKVVFEIEVFQLPAPDIRLDETHTHVVLFAHRDLARMDKANRVRACYQHCCLRYVSSEVMTNTSLRDRLGLAEADYPVASRVIRETVGGGLIKPADPTSRSRKYARYVPFWA